MELYFKQESLLTGVLRKNYSENFCKVFIKMPELESLFNKVDEQKAPNFFKKMPQGQSNCFCVQKQRKAASRMY